MNLAHTERPTLARLQMSALQTTSPAPIILLVNREELTVRSIESVLQQAGFAVVKAYTARQAIDHVERLRPDLVMVEYRLSDSLGLDTCKAIREMTGVDDSTPFVITTATGLSRSERHECFRSGIWEVFSFPFDPVEIVAQLESFIAARRQVKQAWESAHRDRATGLYNSSGLMARATELVADAQRNHRWTTCVAVGPRDDQTVGSPGRRVEDSSSRPPRISSSHRDSPWFLDRIAAALRGATRASDCSGIMSTNDFLVLAPGTDEPGGATLATRLVWALNDRANLKLRGRSGLQFAAGYYAALDETGGSLTAKELIGRTTQALAAARRGDPGSGTILGFHPA